jgi:hypothetical protein
MNEVPGYLVHQKRSSPPWVSILALKVLAFEKFLGATMLHLYHATLGARTVAFELHFIGKLLESSVVSLRVWVGPTYRRQ